jgi:hypothetical protein
MFNNDRISHWFVGAVFTWVIVFLLWGLLVLHLWLKVPVAKVAILTGLACAVQLAVTPWLFSARATRQNPNGMIARRARAVIVWFSVTALLFFCYFPLSLHRGSDSRLFSTIAFAMTVVLGLVAFIIVGVVSRRHKDSIRLTNSTE